MRARSGGLRSWLAFGTGVGIEIQDHDLRVVLARVRPSGIDVLAAASIERFRERPAAEWGQEYNLLIRRHGAGHLSATVALPRRDVIVRTVLLPGVAENDLEAALALQIDGLHPYPEGEAAWSWAKLHAPGAVLVGLARQPVIDHYAEKFAEAGIKIASFTFSAALCYSAVRLMGQPPAEGFLGITETPGGVEVYGESPARPCYSASYLEPWERAAVLSLAELRLSSASRPRELVELFPPPRRVPATQGEPLRTHMLAYLAALAAACPHLALRLNLLPPALRVQSSRWIYVPTLVLGALFILGLVAVGVYSRYENLKYLRALEAEIASLEPLVKKLAELDSRTDQARRRIELLDRFQARTKTDLDALREATKILAPPAWLNTLELSRTAMVVAGEADQATGLLKALDGSPLFQGSEFLVPLMRVGNTEVFRIRSAREGAEP
ncbi:MAG: hypothetical protein NZV14_12135 [Bryobacteraceae bacterium]|nr:hypothetical protein [Bryobacteraceae bacterium]MDW8378902.1 hypothetical protein [Bryobacterales bacterium]